MRMNPLIKFLVVCALILGAPWAACEITYPNIYVRYRLTVEVDDGGQVRTGSGVVEIKYPIFPDILIAGGAFHGVLRGNAITVDLGHKGLIFLVNSTSVALALKPHSNTDGFRDHSEDLWALPLAAYGFPDGGMPSYMKPVLRKLQRESHEVSIPMEMTPMIVRFRDINDPSSIEEVDPTDLAATFGSGVKLKRATVQITGDPVTPAPSSWPDWLVQGKKPGIGLITKNKANPVQILNISVFKGE
jgi:hypothetical protein